VADMSANNATAGAGENIADEEDMHGFRVQGAEGRVQGRRWGPPGPLRQGTWVVTDFIESYG
jgi:hypothetical protein